MNFEAGRIGAEENIWTSVGEKGGSLHNEELHYLYASPNIVRMIKSRRMRCAGHVARMGEMRNGYNILIGKSEGKGPLGRLGVD
jgi:hypothetical protein